MPYIKQPNIGYQSHSNIQKSLPFFPSDFNKNSHRGMKEEPEFNPDFKVLNIGSMNEKNGKKDKENDKDKEIEKKKNENTFKNATNDKKLIQIDIKKV